MHPAQPLSCHVEDRGDLVRMIAVGEIDYRTRDAFDNEVRGLLARTRGELVLDLTGLTYISSEGMASLVAATIRANDTGTRLTIAPSPRIQRRLEIVGLTSFLNVAATPDPPAPPDGTA
jgi:anti-anti-sigma factor